MNDEVELGRLLRTRWGRRLLISGCSALAAALLLWNMPVPGLRGEYRQVARPAYHLAQLDQNWALFAPDVLQASTFVHVEIVNHDGSVEVQEFPRGGPWIATYRVYRWSAYEEALLRESTLRDEALAHTLDQLDDPTAVARIDLVLLESDLAEGSHGPYEASYRREVIATVTP